MCVGASEGPPCGHAKLLLLQPLSSAARRTPLRHRSSRRPRPLSCTQIGAPRSSDGVTVAIAIFLRAGAAKVSIAAKPTASAPAPQRVARPVPRHPQGLKFSGSTFRAAADG